MGHAVAVGRGGVRWRKRGEEPAGVGEEEEREGGGMRKAGAICCSGAHRVTGCCLPWLGLEVGRFHW